MTGAGGQAPILRWERSNRLHRSLFKRIFRGNSGLPRAGPEPTRNGLPLAGNVYAFRTSPLSEFAAAATGRHASFKVIGANEELVVIAVLDGIWRERPSLRQAVACSILREERFPHRSSPRIGGLAVFGLNSEWWYPSDLEDVCLLGITRLSAAEMQLAGNVFRHLPGTAFSTLRSVNWSAEGEWRWAHDRAALVAEVELVNAKQAAIRAAQEERYRTRLSKLTWEQLLSETPFERWTPSPPFPPAEFTNEARAKVHEACRKLSAMGPKPRKASVRAVLKDCVEWFNDADERAGGVIETEEREDICATLEELAFVARQRSLVEEVELWRTW